MGIRGYYSSSMGPTDGNDYNLYDDAIVLVTPKSFQTFNANTDPSFARKNGRSLAVLMAGRYKFYKGKHKGRYNALRAYPEGVKLPCTREGKITVCSLINIHKGGMSNSSSGVTWSEGCQTLPPKQWDSFITSTYQLMMDYGLKTIDYILV